MSEMTTIILNELIVISIMLLMSAFFSGMEQLGLSYQNFNNLVSNRTSGIKFENLQALCEILDCTPNDLFEEYYQK